MIDAGLWMDDDSLCAAEERVASGVVLRVVTQGALDALPVLAGISLVFDLRGGK